MTQWTVAGLLARVNALEAALQPFAHFAAGFKSRSDSHCIVSNALGELTVADLRRAVAALRDHVEVA